MVGLSQTQGLCRWWKDSRVLLALIAVQAFLIRLFSVVKHEVLLHEYDPYFNYKCAEYMQRHGLLRFWQSFDEGSWYPLGRRVGQTVYPGLMVWAYSVHQLLQYVGIDASLKDVCVLLPPVLNIGTVLAVYMLTWEITKNGRAAITSAFFVASMPGLISRTAAGAFDNEALAIPLMVWSFYAWLVAVNGSSLMAAAGAAGLTFLMALSWGGYVFVVNTVACCTVAAMLVRVEVRGVCLVYLVYHALTVSLCSLVPMIGTSALGAMEMKFPHAVFLLALMYLVTCSLSLKAGVTRFIMSLSMSVALISVVFRGTASTSSLSGRLMGLLRPGSNVVSNPLVASISEHQPTRWTNMVLDIWVALVYIPIGLYASFKDGVRIGYLMLAIWAVLSSYFAAAMIRLGLIFAPAAAILGGIGVASTLEKRNLRAKNSFTDLLLALLTGILLLTHVVHATWVACTIYSNPNVMSSWHTAARERLVADDFRDAYSWMRHNLKRGSVVMAWWDYGYQLKQMANCAVITDNNTSNYDQIALTAMIFASKEKEAHQILTMMDVNYVMVVYGGLAKLAMDDISKFPWMVRIASRVFPQVQKLKFFGSDGVLHAKETLLHHLCYNGVHAVSNYDLLRMTNVPELKVDPRYFTEAFTSENWVVRIYRVEGGDLAPGT